MILVVGQNLAWQKVGHLSRLARGEVNRLLSMRAFGSSKGPNVVRALAALGGSGEAIGYAGGATGRRLEDDLRAEGLSCRFVTIQDETRTCTTIAEPDGTCTEVIEPSPRVTEEERLRMRRLAVERLSSARLLIVSGTALEGETDDCYVVLLRAAHERNLPVMLDSACRQARLALSEKPEVVKINAQELGEMANAPVGTLAERVNACRSMAASHGVRWFFVTRGADGMEAFDGRTLLRARAPAVDVINAIGSGDAAAAGAAWVIHEAAAGGPAALFSSSSALKEALLTAVAMGTANCMNPVNGRVMPGDYLAIREQVRVQELPLP